MQQQTTSNASNVTETSSNTDISKSDNTLNLEILKVVKESQQQHGLRHSDYQRYRVYCARRIRRLRKTLNLLCGNNRKFAKRDIQEEDLKTSDNKILLIPLFLAERAWSYAMQLKQESNTDARKKFHLINRLRKAVRFAADLEKLSQSSRCDARTKLEAQGYSSLINGQFLFETQKWNESLNHFNLAKNIYEKLSLALKGDESQVYYSQKVGEIEPNIRYCNYKLGDKSAQKDLIDMKMKSGAGSELADTIDNLISQTKEKQVATLSEIVWRNKVTLPIKNEKVRVFLLNVQEYEKQIQSSSDLDVKISIYENILKDSVDTIQLVRDELKLDQNFQLIQRGQTLQPEDKPSNLLLLFSYLTWLRINKTIERNLIMVDSLRTAFNKQQQPGESSSAAVNKNAKPQDIVRLYDIILQNFKDMSNLPGLLYDKLVQSDIELQCQYFRTFRAYYISLFYLYNKKYKESIGFCFRVETYLKQLESRLPTIKEKETELDKNKLKEFEAQLKQLHLDLNQSKYKIQTNAILEDDSMLDEMSPKEKEAEREKLEKIPLKERLDIYFEEKSTNVVKMGLDYESIPCKPLFFDLALNHVELPSLDDKIDRPARAGQQGQQGVTGLIRGLFGFK